MELGYRGIIGSNSAISAGMVGPYRKILIYIRWSGWKDFAVMTIPKSARHLQRPMKSWGAYKILIG